MTISEYLEVHGVPFKSALVGGDHVSVLVEEGKHIAIQRQYIGGGKYDPVSVVSTVKNWQQDPNLVTIANLATEYMEKHFTSVLTGAQQSELQTHTNEIFDAIDSLEKLMEGDTHVMTWAALFKILNRRRKKSYLKELKRLSDTWDEVPLDKQRGLAEAVGASRATKEEFVATMKPECKHKYSLTNTQE